MVSFEERMVKLLLKEVDLITVIFCWFKVFVRRLTALSI